jgi:hypothetical protein
MEHIKNEEHTLITQGKLQFTAFSTVLGNQEIHKPKKKIEDALQRASTQRRQALSAT